MHQLWIAIGASLALATGTAQAGEPGNPAAPPSVTALSGCWAGTGEVMGKPVKTTLEGRSILLGAMFSVDTESTARDDTADRYAAHLVFGGTMVLPGSRNDITGYWADSFGGAMTSTGTGTSQVGGFDITYAYADAQFVNHWEVQADHIHWSIVAREARKAEQPFADYTLTRVKCPPAK